MSTLDATGLALADEMLACAIEVLDEEKGARARLIVAASDFKAWRAQSAQSEEEALPELIAGGARSLGIFRSRVAKGDLTYQGAFKELERFRKTSLNDEGVRACDAVIEHLRADARRAER